MVTNFAEKEFWENEFYWARVEVPCRPDPSFSFDRAITNELAARAPVAAGQTVFEVGCAPAKWLLFYGERFGAKPSGVEYSAKGAALSRANLDAAGLDGSIYEADFFDLEPEPHDLVLSLGFLEHFDDLQTTFERHLKFVAPGGRLVLGVPNFRGLNRVAQWLADPSYLKMHNLDAMDPEMFRLLAVNSGVELEHVEYLGGFEPALITPSKSRGTSARSLARAIILAGLAYRRLPVAERIDHRTFSSYLIGVFRRPHGDGTSGTGPTRR